MHASPLLTNVILSAPTSERQTAIFTLDVATLRSATSVVIAFQLLEVLLVHLASLELLARPLASVKSPAAIKHVIAVILTAFAEPIAIIA